MPAIYLYVVCAAGDISVCVTCTLKSETEQGLERKKKKERRGTERKEQCDYYTLGINEGH